MIKNKKRQKLGEGYIWFSGSGPKDIGYSHVCLTDQPDGFGKKKILKTGRLGGWKKVKLYAEYNG